MLKNFAPESLVKSRNVKKLLKKCNFFVCNYERVSIFAYTKTQTL